jgi:hypothetical protein
MRETGLEVGATSDWMVREDLSKEITFSKRPTGH